MDHIYILFGGIFSFDGVVTSVGMNTLASMLRKLPNVEVKTYLWQNWSQCYRDITNAHGKTVLVGYSGGGMKATWVANGCVLNDSDAIVHLPQQRIDLLVAYDPSPAISVQPTGENVLRAICYHNTAPFMFGIGGGKLSGPNVTTIDIAMQHLMVQFSQDLHEHTLAAVKEVLQ